MGLPEFIIIGAAKCGTTSLAQYLTQHPQIYFCPEKEPNYFAFAGERLPEPGPASSKILQQLLYAYSVTDYDRYLSLFRDAPAGKVVGEASVRYIYHAQTAYRLKEKIPQARLVAVLRDPVSRLYSHYCMNVQYQLEPLGLEEALEAEAARCEAKWGYDWHYVGVGRYAEQLKRYYEVFDRSQIRVFLYDDFVKQPLPVLDRKSTRLNSSHSQISYAV